MLDLSRQIYGRLTVLEEVERQGKHRRWLCQCSCGRQKVVAANALRMGRVRSCGCLNAELAGAKFRTHGMCGTPTYSSWHSMIVRCHDPASSSYRNYGARGVVVCDAWRESFLDFLAEVGPRPAGTTLDRIENSKGYEPGNCRWATSREQRMNQARGTISMEDADRIRELRKAHGWGPRTIAKHLGLPVGAINGVIGSGAV